jgi:predicted enzyme involved in methoxymalonyl-ACP biosynthesis
MKIGLCGNISLSFLADELSKVLPNDEFVVGGFNQYAQELVQPHRYFPDISVIIIALDWREAIPCSYAFAFGDDTKKILAEIDAFCQHLLTLLSGFRQASIAKIVVFSPIADWYSPMGFIDRILQSGQHTVTAYVQSSFNELCRKISDVYPLDVEQIAQRVGKQNVYDPRMRQLARAPYTYRMNREIALSAKIFSTQIINSPIKCLILDLDNTIWGGIVGEDGMENLQLGELGIGRSYKEFQIEIRRLYFQGIFLAVCSKNNPDDALRVFEAHPDMILKRDMISSLRIN